MKTWKGIIDDLVASGLSKTELAELAGTSQQVIGELASGRSKEPRGMTAVRLHQLHALRCSRDVSKDAPAEKAA